MNGITPAELGRLYDAYAAGLLLFARQWLNRQSAEDVVQDVFLRLMSQARPPTDAKAWLFKAVRNAGISAWRSQSRRARRQDLAARVEPALQSSPDDAMDAKLAESTLAGLNAHQREVVVLRIWAGMTFAQVAELVQAPLSTVHDRYRAALNNIRAQLESPCRNSRT